ncbi:MAG TPA: hypothetical protein VFU15_11280 [Bacteroidia bacterium]|nr:hypothetical protein [Bacteroidia bacterium]
MADNNYREELSVQNREMQIMMIREKHPVYKDFNFEPYNDRKVAEMFHVLVENYTKTEKETGA